MKTMALFLVVTFFTLSSAAQSVDPIYKGGGILRPIYGPTDDGARMISMQLYCDKEPSGHVYSKLGIFDVTEQDDAFGQYFSFGAGNQARTFALDDRKPGQRNYTVNISAREGMPIKFGRPGNEDQIATSRDRLRLLRARHAIDHGTTVTMGSKEFLIIPQGGSLPGFAFFPGDLSRRLAGGDLEAVFPLFCVKTMRRLDTGQWVKERGPLSIGKVDGRFYELTFDPQTSNWMVQASSQR